MANDAIEQFIAEQGPWTAMAIRLPDGSYTLPPAADHRLRRIVQTASDLVGKPLSQCRVLDLACLEGHYGIEFALHGAEVVGIEGRAASVAKCEFAKRALALERIEFFQDDVRGLSVEKYGRFDIVLCSGLLYHLPAQDAWRLIQSMHDSCSRLVIVDTFIALSSQLTTRIDGRDYHGHVYGEHDPAESAEDKRKKLWASLDNDSSFWFTEPSLMNLLSRAGFSSLFDVLAPTMPGNPRDRKTYIGLKAPRVDIRSSEPTDAAAHADIPEGLNPRFDPSQTPRGRVFKAAKRLLPAPVKAVIKPVLRTIGVLPPDETPAFMRKRKG
jgi:hypothetical protein